MARRSGAVVINGGELTGNRAMLLAALAAAVDCQQSAAEFRLLPPRRWRADLAWPDHKVAVEFQGGAHVGGHHVRGQGFEDDCEKQLVCAAAGWRILPVTWRMLERRLPAVAGFLDLVLACTDPAHRHQSGLPGWDPVRREFYPG